MIVKTDSLPSDPAAFKLALEQSLQVHPSPKSITICDHTCCVLRMCSRQPLVLLIRPSRMIQPGQAKLVSRAAAPMLASSVAVASQSYTLCNCYICCI